MKLEEKVIKQLNDWGKAEIPFGFLIDFKCRKPIVFQINEPNKNIFWLIPNSERFETNKTANTLQKWEISPVSFSNSKKGLIAFNRLFIMAIPIY